MKATNITHLTYANAAIVATMHAADDYGEERFQQLPVAEKNRRVEPYLRHMWRALESNQANRRATRRQPQKAA